MDLIRRSFIALLPALIAAGCSRPQATVFRAAPMAATWVLPPATPRVSPCSWLGVVVDNAIPARPQWGLSQADVVYEVPTEAMITRFLALFCTSGPDTVGPVRSLRLQFLVIARDYAATIAHSGSSESALDVVRRGAGPVINEAWNARPFRRDRARPMPHNVFTSVDRLRTYLPLTSPSSGRLWATADLSPASKPMTLTIPYGRGYTARFDYDPKTGRYRRFIDGRPAVDGLTGDQIEVAAVIVQYARWWQVYEGPILTSRMELTGEGKITIFAAGTQTDGTWYRPDPSGPMQLADQEGHQVRLPAGRVWISLLPVDRTVEVGSAPTRPGR